MTLSPCGSWVAWCWVQLGDLAARVAVPEDFRPDIAAMASEDLRRRAFAAESTPAGRFLWTEIEAACRDLAAGVWNGEDRVCD